MPVQPTSISRHVLAERDFDPFFNWLSQFGQLSADERAGLSRIFSKPFHVSAKSDFVGEEQAGELLHILLDGWACRFRTVAEGRRQITALGLPGEILDIDRLYLQRPGCGLSALTHCHIVTMTRSDLTKLFRAHPRLVNLFGWLLAVDNSILTESSVRLGRRSSRERFAHFLCEGTLRLKQRARAEGYECQWPITQEQLADILGLTPVHVNRTLQELRSGELIEYGAHRLRILDWDRLAGLGSFDPSYLHLKASEEWVRFSPDPFAGASQAFVTQQDEQSADFERTLHLELRHRFKNLIATTQSLARQSLKDGGTMEQAREALTARLAAMGKAMDTLAAGEFQHGSLRRAVQETLSLSSESGRIDCRGPDVRLNARALVALILALHELQTNAMKYGALSNEEGRVDLIWTISESVSGSRLQMQWSETGGPLVIEPRDTGFGTRLLSSATERALSGQTVLEYTPEGLRWLLLAPLEKLTTDESEGLA